MNFKATKRSLVLIALCCCISLYGAISYLEPIQSSLLNDGSSIAAATRTIQVADIFNGCRQPQQLRTDIPLTYAAIIPIIDANFIYLLVHAVSGLQIVNIDPSSSGALLRLFQTQSYANPDESIIRHTAYPYTHGNQAPSYYTKDGRVSRAFIVVQNPLHVISQRFLVTGRNDWDRWIEVHLDQEIALYHRFFCYWLDRNTPQHRLVMSYEGLSTDQSGNQAIMTLNNFLGGPADIDAHCIWNGMINIFRTVRRLDIQEQVTTNGTLILQQHSPHHRSNLPQHPFTNLQLGKIGNMLAELAQRYKDEEPVYAMLIQYNQDVLAAMSQVQHPQHRDSQLESTAGSNILTKPLQICGRTIPFSLENERQIAEHYASQCPLFKTQVSDTTKSSDLLLMRGYERFGRTGNNLIEFLHALQYGRENDVIVGIMLDSWPMALITKFWMALPTDNLHNEDFLSDGIIEWKDHIEQAFCIKIFLSEEELAGYDDIIEMTARELFMFRYKAEVKEYIQFQLHNIRMLFRSYNIGVGKDVKNRNVGNLCSVIDGVFGDERESARYSVIHSRSLEGAPGLRLLGILSGTSGCDPVAALNMEPEYIKAILAPLGLLQHPILFISDNQRPEILEHLTADEEIGPMLRVVPNDLSWVGGDLAVAIMANAFIGNPASTFSGFIAKSRIALGFDNNFLFRVKKDGEWIDSCEDRCIFYKWVMRSMA